MVAENHVHGGLGVFVAVDRVKLCGSLGMQPTVAVAGEENALTPSQDTLVSRHPMNAETVCNCQHLFRNTTFRWPHSPRPYPEDFLMELQPPLKLLPSIFRMTEPILRQRQSWRGHGRDICITQQRQNGMIVRRTREFDRTTLCRIRVNRQYFGDQFALAGDHEALVFERVIAALSDECGNFRIFEEEFIEPGDLGKNLQIGEVLGPEKFFRVLGRVPRATKTVPQFPVTGVPADHIYGIRLEKILQGEASLVSGEIFSRFCRNVQEGIMRRTCDVILNLRNQ